MRVTRMIIGAIGIGGSAVLMVAMLVASRTWWMAFPTVLVILALLQEWRYFYRAETGQTYRGVSLKKTAWWNFVGYYVLLAFLVFMLLCLAVWHVSDVVMLSGFLPFVVVLGVWVVVRMYKMPKLPKPSPPRMLWRR